MGIIFRCGSCNRVVAEYKAFKKVVKWRNGKEHSVVYSRLIVYTPKPWVVWNAVLSLSEVLNVLNYRCPFCGNQLNQLNGAEDIMNKVKICRSWCDKQ
jgi:hypothetical protein